MVLCTDVSDSQYVFSVGCTYTRMQIRTLLSFLRTRAVSFARLGGWRSIYPREHQVVLSSFLFFSSLSTALGNTSDQKDKELHCTASHAAFLPPKTRRLRRAPMHIEIERGSLLEMSIYVRVLIQTFKYTNS